MRLIATIAALSLFVWVSNAEACKRGCGHKGWHHHQCGGGHGHRGCQNGWGCYAWQGYSCMGGSHGYGCGDGYGCADGSGCSAGHVSVEPTAAERAKTAHYAARAKRTEQLQRFYAQHTGRVETNPTNLEMFYTTKMKEISNSPSNTAVARRPAPAPAVPVARTRNPRGNEQAAAVRPVVVAPAKRS